MEEVSTNVDLENIEIVGGVVIPDPEGKKTKIPPEGVLKTTSEKDKCIVITLQGEGYNKEIKKNKEQENEKA